MVAVQLPGIDTSKYIHFSVILKFTRLPSCSRPKLYLEPYSQNVWS